MMNEMPRNRLIVPMVTTIEGSFSPVTSQPLNAPQSSPTSAPMATRPGVSTPICAAAPISVEASAMMPATEMSISPAMIRSAIGKAISAFSVKLKVASLSENGSRKYGEAKQLMTKITTATTSSRLSQLNSAARSGLSSRSGTARGLGASVIGHKHHVFRRFGDNGHANHRRHPPPHPSPQGAGAQDQYVGIRPQPSFFRPPEDQAALAPLAAGVEDHREDDGGARNGGLPERRYVDHRQRVVDEAEEQRAEHRPAHRPDAAGDRDAADDAGGDHRQLIAIGDLDGGDDVARHPEIAGQPPGDPREAEGDEHRLADIETGIDRGGRIDPHRIERAADGGARQQH